MMGHAYMVEMAMFNVQRAMTLKEGKPVTVHLFYMSSHSAIHLY